MELIEDEEVLKEYNDAVVNSEKDAKAYSSKRIRIIEERNATRKSKRNLMWYIKRLRLQYLQLIIDGRRNSKLYNDNIKKYL